MLRHKGCGGEVIEDVLNVAYRYEHDDGTVEEVYGMVCGKCDQEMLGDADIEDSIGVTVWQ